MESRRFKLVEVPCVGHPTRDELTLHFGLLAAQMKWLDGVVAAGGAEADDDSLAATGLINLAAGLKDVAAFLGVPSSELYPRRLPRLDAA